MPNWDTMNETDVRETLVRPLLTRLGYAHGTEADIRTEQTFRYERAFLGHKKPKKDPPLVGRADYILEVVGFGRWVVEVKAPGEELTLDVVEQTHTYTAHPEVAGLFFLITNGRRFRLFRTSWLSGATMEWAHEETEEIFLSLKNLVGPEAIKRKMQLLAADPGKPLAPGVASEVKIIGGFVRYEDHSGNHTILHAEIVNGLKIAVTGGLVKRLPDGRIHAQVVTADAMPLSGELGRVLGNKDGNSFFTIDNLISTDHDKPTIFQSVHEASAPAGTELNILGVGKYLTQFSIACWARSEAIGFIENDTFTGTMQLSYEYTLGPMPAIVRMDIEKKFGPLPPKLLMSGGGIFEVKILNL